MLNIEYEYAHDKFAEEMIDNQDLLTSFLCPRNHESEVVCFSAQGGSNKNGGDSAKSS